MTIETLKNLLQRNGLSPNKTYGQHFLMDETILEDMIDAAQVTEKDTVVEVGPGIGNLTGRLLQHGAKVLSLEKDEQFTRVLRGLKKQYPNFEYVFTDVLKFNFNESGIKNYKVVANIPYYITGKIIQLFLAQETKPQSLTLLIQKEVAKNVVAKPGQLNLLALSVQLYGEAELVTIVPAHKFHPKPKVDSAVINIKLYKTPKYKIADQKKFFRILKACFAGKRKQIHNTLTNNLGVSKDVTTKILSELKIATSARPQQLTIEQWIDLYQNLDV